ncbi:MAG: RecQ family ATP-dependent DNA helicase [Bacteroidales bacterium]|nr:RecQ family ATP-dependent DNA helicase [Bacteroidales bacterium]
MTNQQILIKYWGYSSFRPAQEEIIDNVLAGKDTLALLPTGGGKSICFQVPALQKEGICIVVTPLIALMKDQVQQLKNRGIIAAAIYSGMNYHQIDIILDNCVFGDVKFLYVSPERLETELFQERLKRMNVNLLAVDEAHCISQWGYDFRPSYLTIADIRELVPEVPILALTATATPDVVVDIQEKLQFNEYNLIQRSFNRENLTYVVLQEEDKNRRLLELLSRNQGSSIIYVRSRKATKEVARFLIENKISAHFYHAGLTTELRDQRQQDWIQGKIRVMVSTNAFGMGIDKANVRSVIHLDIPDSIEAYFQEAGRAGRDQKQAYTFLLYHKTDINTLKYNHEQKFPEIKFILQAYNALGNYFQLAEGSGVDKSFEFVLTDFAKMYNLNPLSVYYSLKYLEKEGYLYLSDAVNRPSRVLVRMDRQDLYRFQVKYPKLGDFIDVLIRSYSALFTDFAVIDESSLANRLNASRLLIENTLKQLHKMDVLEYIPYSSRPQISLVGGRLSIKNMRINREDYESRKQISKKRMEAMANYVQSFSKCRNILLLEYFGEKDLRRCGRCDVCIGRNKIDLSQQEFDKVIEQVKPILKAQNCSLQELVFQIKNVDEERVIKVIRWLMDIDKISQFGDLLVWN